MTSPPTFEELIVRAHPSEQMEKILRAMYSHRDEQDLTYAKLGEYCKLTPSQVANSIYDYRSNFQDKNAEVRARIQLAGRMGKKGRRLTG